MQTLGRLADDDGEGAAGAGKLRTLARVVPEPKRRVLGNRQVEALRRRDVGNANPEVVDRAAAADRTVVDGLGAVPVRVEEEGPVVVAAVLWTRSGLAVALVAGTVADLPEAVDVLPRRRREADVEVRVTRFSSSAAATMTENSLHSAIRASLQPFSMPRTSRTVS